jgi:hypothetical protein
VVLIKESGLSSSDIEPIVWELVDQKVRLFFADKRHRELVATATQTGAEVKMIAAYIPERPGEVVVGRFLAPGGLLVDFQTEHEVPNAAVMVHDAKWVTENYKVAPIFTVDVTAPGDDPGFVHGVLRGEGWRGPFWRDFVADSGCHTEAIELDPATDATLRWLMDQVVARAGLGEKLLQADASEGTMKALKKAVAAVTKKALATGKVEPVLEGWGVSRFGFGISPTGWGRAS